MFSLVKHALNFSALTNQQYGFLEKFSATMGVFLVLNDAPKLPLWFCKKPYVCQKSGSQVINENTLGQSVWRTFNI